MKNDSPKSLALSMWTTSGWTLVSRVLGLLRDMATASLLGLAASGVMDSFVIAFRIPNLFRGLLGEGALAASYLPVITRELERDRASGWRLASVLLTWLTLALGAVVLVGELLCAAAWWSAEPSSSLRLLAGLSAVMLPYLLLICLAAQVAATLQALSHFHLPAMTPALLNILWLAAAWWVAPSVASSKSSQAYVLACAVLLGGMVQLGVLLPALRSFGFRWDYQPRQVHDAIRGILAAMTPLAIALAVTRINTLLDSFLAWGLARPEGGENRITWLMGWTYPLEQGAASAIYLGERMYHLPVGLFGVAVATVVFPQLSRHAARDDLKSLAGDLTLGLRLVLFIALPAGAGLMLLAEPLAQLLFEHGEFTAADTRRTARLIAVYSCGVWAYCALPVLLRGYYALADQHTPMRTSLAAVGLNLTLNLALLWPLAEAGLAAATATTAMLQAAGLAIIFSRRHARLNWKALGCAMLRAVIATGIMAAATYGALVICPTSESITSRAIRVAAPVVTGIMVYTISSWTLRSPELRALLGRHNDSTS